MNINLNLDKLLENIVKLLPVILAFVIVASLILFLPVHMLSAIHLANIPESIMTIISIAWLFGTFLLLIIIIQQCIMKPFKSYKSKRLIKKLKYQYKMLSPQQKNIIKRLLNSTDKKVKLPMNNGDANYLCANRFIYMPTQITDTDFDTLTPVITYLAQPWLITVYNDDPDFFK